MYFDNEFFLNSCVISSSGLLIVTLLLMHILSTVTGKLPFSALFKPFSHSSECSDLSIARVIIIRLNQRVSVHKQPSVTHHLRNGN